MELAGVSLGPPGRVGAGSRGRPPNLGGALEKPKYLVLKGVLKKILAPSAQKTYLKTTYTKILLLFIGFLLHFYPKIALKHVFEHKNAKIF